MRIEIISTMTFNDDGKIASMKAYWTPENITSFSPGVHRPPDA